jgi:hypothetical protein
MDFEKVYIYALIDPCSDDIRYIGKSIDPEQRYYGIDPNCGEKVNDE